MEQTIQMWWSLEQGEETVQDLGRNVDLKKKKYRHVW